MKSGRFASPVNVVESGLDRLVEEEVLGSYEPDTLRAMIEEGIAAADRGETVSLEEAKAHILSPLRPAEAR